MSQKYNRVQAQYKLFPRTIRNQEILSLENIGFRVRAHEAYLLEILLKSPGTTLDDISNTINRTFQCSDITAKRVSDCLDLSLWWLGDIDAEVFFV